jgi:hypothetical protein
MAAALVRCAYGAVTGSGYRNAFINTDGQNYPFVSFLEGSMEARPYMHLMEKPNCRPRLRLGCLSVM